jgi:cytochrome c peroxidase
LDKEVLILRSVVILAFMVASATFVSINFFPATRTVNAALQPLGSKTYRPQIPKGIPRWKWSKLIPRDNPLTVEKIALGEGLYFDKRLSVDGAVSCATCHDPATAFADRNSLAVGVGGRVGTRNVPTTLNSMFNQSQFWDGRARSLEAQAMQPLLNPLEMGMPDREAVVTRLNAIPEYRQSFDAAFGAGAITFENVARAIASYERTLLSADSPFDRFMAGNPQAISQAQKRGWQLFRGKANCIACHTFTPGSPFFTDYKFHNTGITTGDLNLEVLLNGLRSNSLEQLDSERLNELAHTEKLTELGRFLITKQKKDIGAFKTPTLRDIELTAPYMHNASEKTLLDVMKFYNEGSKKNRYLDEKIRPLNLSDEELSDLVEFMRALTSDSVLRRAQQTSPQSRTPVVLPLANGAVR